MNECINLTYRQVIIPPSYSIVIIPTTARDSPIPKLHTTLSHNQNIK